MVGQKELLKKLYSYTSLQEVPNSMLFIGEVGCGKHTLSQELANYYSIPLIDLTNSISVESIEQIYLHPTQAFYLIDMDKVSDRQQNALLKFIEEPLQNSHIILISSSKTSLFETILNRCRTFEFAPYSQEELSSFIDELCEEKEDILSICTTPGQIKSVNVTSLKGMNELCETMLTKLGVSKYSNALTIVNKINYKDEFDKYDYNLFLRCLRNHLYKSYLNNNNMLHFQLYNDIINKSKLLSAPNIRKEYFMEYLITTLWERSRNEIK